MLRKKFIVTNKSHLQNKYLNEFQAIQSAFIPLISVDKTDGIDTTVIYMDDEEQMNSLKATAITDPNNEQQTKVAIDSLFASQDPDFVTIFGASDVVVLQSLENPAKGEGDGDTNVPSDLPYACNAEYNTSINHFLNPSRDITRLPDMVGGSASAYPLRVLSNAANQKTSSLNAYKQYFGISTDQWQSSTKTSVTNVYGNSTNLNISPPSGPNWSAKELQEMSFFFNLHGGNENPNFYNGHDDYYGKPVVCFTSEQITPGLTTNMLISVEACYGAQLYNPSNSTFKQQGICSAAIYAGCCAYFGSTNIAYGPPDGQGQADIITQKFLIHLFEGKSIGQAALEARTDFISVSDMLLPTNVKTLGQFLVIGNGGFEPVEIPTESLVKALEKQGINIMSKDFKSENEKRARAIRNTVDSSEPAPDHPIPKIVQKTINTILSSKNFLSHSISIHKVNFNKNHAKLYENAGDVHIYTLHAVIGQRPYGEHAIVYHIKATEDNIIEVVETHTK